MRTSSTGLAVRPWLQSSARILIAVLAVAALCFVSSVSVGIRLLAGTVLGMGGAANPTGESMRDELNGYLNPASSNFGIRPGYEFQPVPWNSAFWLPGTTFDALQNDGVTVLDGTIRASLQSGEQDSKVVVVGYSASANVVIRELRNLDAEGDSVPSPAQVSFLVFGGPNRPNGGIFTRLPGLYVPILGIPSDGANPDTDYELTDISWRWDPISDFPLYPLNPFALANAAFGFYYLHSDYFEADLANADLTLSGTAPDGTKYITINPEHLPLLQPFYDLGLPKRPLDALEPVLTELVELSYDRTVPVWQSTPIRLLPPPEHVLAALPKLRDALAEGADILAGDHPDAVEEATVDQLKTVEPLSVSAPTWRAPRPPRALSIGEGATTTTPEPASVGKPRTVRESLAVPSGGPADRVADGLKELAKQPRVKVPNRPTIDRPDPVGRALREVRDGLSHNKVRPLRQARVSSPASNR